ncbi:hypothetical protein V8G54_034888 [Vigna mungo]|uniref:Uncharacterized protein n=1 Tax=Vigna mungo TaxID=3915 RepID=A0AAQ3ME67_VIGMU
MLRHWRCGEMVVKVAAGGRVLRDSVMVVRGELMVVVQRRRRLRSVVKGGHLAVDLLAMKIPVAVAGSANHGLQSAVLAGRHELAASVDSVSAEAHGVVLLAFSVAYRGGAERALPSLAADFGASRRVSKRVVTCHRRWHRRVRHPHFLLLLLLLVEFHIAIHLLSLKRRKERRKIYFFTNEN